MKGTDGKDKRLPRLVIKGEGTVTNPDPLKDRFIQTFTGRKFYPFDLERAEIDILDIAIGLGREPRFAGHTIKTYSVAQHSTMTSLVVPQEFALEALLHDAQEAYLRDLGSPIKQGLPDYQALEKKVSARILSEFGLGFPISEETHKADAAVFTTEVLCLMCDPTVFTVTEPPLRGANGQMLKIIPLSEADATFEFLRRFHVLTRNRAPHMEHLLREPRQYTDADLP